MGRRRLAVAACLMLTTLVVPAAASAAPPTCSPATGLEAEVQAGESITLPAAPCTDSDGDAVSIEITQEPSSRAAGAHRDPTDRGRAHVPANPDAGGLSDTIKFRAVAGGENSNEATFEIHISVNHAPVCPGHVEVTIVQDSKLVFTSNACSDEDGDPLSVFLIEPPSHGSITPLSPVPPWTYTPAPGYVGHDRLIYQAHDASTNSGPAELGITMTAAPRVTPPVVTPPVVSPPATDVTAPALSLATLSRTLALRRTLTRGVRVTLTLGEPGRAVIRLLLSRADARRLGINRKAKRAVVVGKISRTLAAGQAKVNVKLTRKARRRLARVRRVKLTLDVAVTDAAGNLQRVRRHLILR